MMGDLVSSNRAGTSLPDSPSSLERLIQSLNWEEAVGSTGYQSSHSPPLLLSISGIIYSYVLSSGYCLSCHKSGLSLI